MNARGFSVLELMIAMALMTMVMGGVVMTSFGNQGNLVGGQIGAEAMNIAQDAIEREQALSRKDFNLVNATSSTDGFYTATVTVDQQPDYFTKKATVTVGWKDQRNIPRTLDVATLISDFTNTAGGSTCNSSLSGDWTNPQIKNSTTNLAQLVGDAAGTYTPTTIDAYKGLLYVGASVGGATNKTLFVLNPNPGGNPTLVGSLDTTGTTVSSGPADMVVVATTTAASGKVYAYVANGYGPNFATCTPSPYGANGGTCAQMQVVDVTTPSAPTLARNYFIATNTTPYVLGNAGQAAGASIAYKNGYIYLGLTKTASGPEFHVIDVHDPLNPQILGSYTVGATVQNIYVRGNYAYLATASTTAGLVILDLTDPTKPKQLWSTAFPAPVGKGKSIAGVADTLYFGKNFTSNVNTPEFSVLNNPTPSTAVPTQTLGLEMTSSVNAILIRDYLAFLATGAGFQILNATSSATVATVPVVGTGATLDCEGNYLYVGSYDASNKGYLYVVTTP